MRLHDETSGRRGLLSALAGRRPSRPVSLRPPWNVGHDAFAERCTGCGSCIDVCPPGILQKDADGKAALNFAAGGCNFCGKCAKACEEGCFEIVAGRPALALVAHVDASCLELSGVSCRLCEDTCPASALRARPVGGGRRVVLLDAAACTGCGICVSTCPPRAIAVRERPQPEART